MIGLRQRKQQRDAFKELLQTNRIVQESYHNPADEAKMTRIMQAHTDYHTPANDTLPRCKTEYIRLVENEGKEYVVGSFFSEPRRERYYVVYPHNELTKDDVTKQPVSELHKDTVFMRISFVNPVTWFVDCFKNNSKNAYQFFVYCDWDMKNVSAFVRYFADKKEKMSQVGENTETFKVASGPNGFNGFRYIEAEPILDTFKKFIIASNGEKADYAKGGNFEVKTVEQPVGEGYEAIWSTQTKLHPKYHEEFLRCAYCYDIRQRDR